MATPALQYNEAEQAFLDAYRDAGPRLPGAGLDWLAALREAGLDAFKATGLPHRRVEIFKYTDLRRHLSEVLAPAAPVDGMRADLEDGLAADPLAEVAAYDLVLVNGFFRADLSADLPEGVEVLGMAEALASPPEWLAATLGRVNPQDGHPIQGLNIALFGDGVAVRIAKGTVLDKPLRLVHLTPKGQGGTVRHVRSLIALDPMAEAQLIETYRSAPGEAPAATAVTELAIGDGARLGHTRALAEGPEAVNLNSALVRIGRDATYDGFISAARGGLSRSEIYARFAAPGGHAKVNGIYLLDGTRHADITSFIDHAVPDCTSDEVFRAVLDGESTGVFQGKILVREDAQRTDGKMLAQALLLSDKAEMDAKPELEIYADDVKCAHGATTGQIDRDALFYLQSRGLPSHEARRLLVEAFLDEALAGISLEPVREALAGQVADWLGTRPAVKEA